MPRREDPTPEQEAAREQRLRAFAATRPPFTPEQEAVLRPLLEGTVAPRESGQRDAS